MTQLMGEASVSSKVNYILEREVNQRDKLDVIENNYRDSLNMLDLIKSENPEVDLTVDKLRTDRVNITSGGNCVIYFDKKTFQYTLC